MLRKAARTALAVAVVSATALTVTGHEAEAGGRHHRHDGGAIAAGAIIGLAAGAIIGSAASQPYYAPPPVYYAPGPAYGPAYYGPPMPHCVLSPVHRWDPYYGQYVVVGQQEVCN
ncbi:hypothetical protein [Polymorphum gilvum]|uniref:Transmembrane protein n=1 Tax=Polymorphum gilvum (strain LMG 25793 / CGMCC 1.9160 / SL003B-26A1) TaxID=991905 RepID=F2IV88_POLGS|nr:hypothetical protein [Polymorphum gilvum]ADZ71419.1 hypothetical protein SL003B_2996 [Polymorphum gilvum SL003B-26A1]